MGRLQAGAARPCSASTMRTERCCRGGIAHVCHPATAGSAFSARFCSGRHTCAVLAGAGRTPQRFVRFHCFGVGAGPTPLVDLTHHSLVFTQGSCVYPADVASLADGDGFSIRAGQHCAQPAHRALGAKFGSARVSLGIYSTIGEIDRFVRSLRDNLEMLRSGEGCMFDPDNPDACYCSSDRVRS